MDSLLRSSGKAHRQPRNRLLSIAHDVEWVGEVGEAYGRPLIPNERCGLWYVDPRLRLDSAYFKSTDGHTGQWSFSTRRLNLHLLDIIPSTSGIILVDSTRRGKTLPDALSKTVPLWCAVINYIMNIDTPPPSNNYLFCPKQCVSESEEHSISQLVPQFAEQVIELGIITSSLLRTKLKGRILRPMWTYPGLSLPFDSPDYEDFWPVICCASSARADDGEITMRVGKWHYTYVQGAADDHELWGESLSPEIFWEHFKELTDPELTPEQLKEVIEKVSSQKKTVKGSSVKDIVSLVDNLSVGTVVSDVKADDVHGFNTVILLSGEHVFVNEDESLRGLYFNCPSNKKGSNELRKRLPMIMATIKDTSKTLILCDNGTDISIGVALAILSSRYNLNWELTNNLLVTKDVIKKHLGKILHQKKVNPSRATLQAVNACLM